MISCDVGYRYTQDWKEYFMDVAETVATKSHCIRRKVGAILVKDKRIIATGYNGLPSGFPHCTTCYQPRNRVSGTRLDGLPCNHAEENALIQCARFQGGAENCVMFCTTFPCNTCLKKIIQAGVRMVFYQTFYSMPPEAEALREFLLENAYNASGFNVSLVVKGGHDHEVNEKMSGMGDKRRHYDHKGCGRSSEHNCDCGPAEVEET